MHSAGCDPRLVRTLGRDRAISLADPGSSRVRGPLDVLPRSPARPSDGATQCRLTCANSDFDTFQPADRPKSDRRCGGLDTLTCGRCPHHAPERDCVRSQRITGGLSARTGPAPRSPEDQAGHGLAGNRNRPPPAQAGSPGSAASPVSPIARAGTIRPTRRRSIAQR